MTTKNQSKCAIVFAVIGAILFMFAASSTAVAQGRYKVGDRVECDAAQIGSFKKGTVVPYSKNDPDQASGRYYRVKVDGSYITEGYECMATHMRRLVDDASPTPQINPDQPQNRNQGGNQSTVNKQSSNYTPGDRVECDAAQIGAWAAGTVMHFLQTDWDQDSGRYYRVRMDKNSKLDPAGQVCMVGFMRLLKDAAKRRTSSATYSVGDRIEAQAYSGGWFPAKIVAVTGQFYKVRFDNHDSRHDESVDAERIRPQGTKETNTVNPPDQPRGNVAPKMAGGFPVIPGTAWKIDWGKKGANVQRFLFCKSGKWEVVSSQLLTGGALTLMGTYKVQGNTIITRASDGKIDNYRMTWNAGVLELNNGKVTMKLYEPVETQCR